MQTRTFQPTTAHTYDFTKPTKKTGSFSEKDLANRGYVKVKKSTVASSKFAPEWAKKKRNPVRALLGFLGIL